MLRFAPSPTGDMHIENLRVALLNYLVAKQHNEPFLVRIADTDKAHNIEGKDTEIMQILEKFAINHDAVYHQSEHLHMHQTLAIRLLEEGKAFVCTCDDLSESTPYSGHCIDVDKSEYTKLKKSGKPFIIRMKKPQYNIVTHDLIRGNTVATPDEVDSFVILDQDASPTALFATACDDMLNNISLIIRQEEKFSDAPKEAHIKQMLGYTEGTSYLHLPIMCDENGNPLNGQEGTITLLHLFEQGFLPDAIINYLLLLSHPDAPKKIFYFPDALTWFKRENIPPTPVTFRMDELREINREHLKMMDDKLLSSLFGFADADIGKLAKVYLEKAATINELAENIRPILAPKVFEGAYEKPMRQIQQVLIDAPMFETFDVLKRYVVRETGMHEKEIHTPLHLLLTGKENGPALETIYPYIRSYLLEVIS